LYLFALYSFGKDNYFKKPHSFILLI